MSTKRRTVGIKRLELTIVVFNVSTCIDQLFFELWKSIWNVIVNNKFIFTIKLVIQKRRDNVVYDKMIDMIDMIMIVILW